MPISSVFTLSARFCPLARCSGITSSSSSPYSGSLRVRFTIKLSESRITAPIFSAIVSHDQPVNNVNPIAQIPSSANVAPRILNHGRIALLNKLPMTPPAAKSFKSSILRATRPHEVNTSAKAPMTRNESVKKSTYSCLSF